METHKYSALRYNFALIRTRSRYFAGPRGKMYSGNGVVSHLPGIGAAPTHVAALSCNYITNL